MSKKKAKLKAQRRMEKRFSEEKARRLYIETEKSNNVCFNQQQKERNQQILKKKKETDKRYQEDHSPEQLFIEKQFKSILDQLIGTIGSDVAVARQFVLEELEASSMGNQHARNFARKSGIPQSNYAGALQASNEKVDGVGGPQQFLNYTLNELKAVNNVDWVVKLRTELVDRVMQIYQFGRYEEASTEAKTEDSPVALAFDEYFRFCADPSIGLHRLSKYILEIKPLITQVSTELEDHYVFYE